MAEAAPDAWAHRGLAAEGSQGTAAAREGRHLEPVTRPADIGALVRDRRSRLGLSQSDLAEKAGVGRRLVSELESGKITVELAKVLIVCRAAGLSLLVSIDDA